METEPNNWNTIESDPGVFTEMIKNLGCQELQLTEIWSFDDQMTFNRIKPIEGFILLFEYNKKAIEYMRNEYCEIDLDEYTDLFFAKQIINNACATQAILSILMNLPHINIGPILQQFKNETMPLTPQKRGEAIGKNEIIRKVHNDFAQPAEALEQRISEKYKHLPGGKAYHFVSIVPYNGILLLLDGFNESPLILGGADEDWVNEVMKPFFEGLISVMQGNLEFTVLAIVPDQIDKYEKLYEEAVDKKNEDIAKVYKEILDGEKQMRKKQFVENKRRKHDYMPLALNLLITMAKRQQLEEQVEKEENDLKK